MPHIAIEFTANLTETVDMQGLVDALHAAADATRVFPTGGIRTLALPSVAGRVGDGTPSNAFVQIRVRIAPGRSPEVKRSVATALFEAAQRALDPVFAERRFGLQLEVSEFDPDLTLSRNTMLDAATPVPARQENRT